VTRTRLFWKLFAGLACLSLLTASLVGLLAVPGLVRGEEQATERHLATVARLLDGVSRPVLAGGDDEALRRYREALGDGDGARITLIRDDGVVLADTRHDPDTMADHANRPEVVQARATGYGRSIRLSDTLQTRMLYVAHRVSDGARPLGTVRVAQSLGHIDQRKADLRNRVVGAASIAVLVSLGLAFFISRRLTRPLRSLVRAAHAFAAGDYERRVDVTSADELGRLGEAFNRMAEQLHERVDTISRDRAELRAILTSMEEGVVAVDRGGRIAVMNDAAGRILGRDPAAAVGEAARDLLPFDEADEILAGALEERRPGACEVTLPSATRDQCLQLHAAPLGGPTDAVQGAVLVLHDISALRHLENVRREFVANVSHELKTPLSAIRGITETILEDPEMDETTRRRFLERVRHQVLRLGEMVEEVLTLSRLESDPQAGAAGRADLGAAVQEVVQAQRPLAAARGIELTVDVPDRALLVRGDAEGLRRILGNLIDNAVKYTPSGGWVRVRTTQVGDQVLAEVEDNGIGIPEEARDRVFERFFRVDPGRSRAAGGTGLGLSIVKHLVAALGGDVRVEASASGGSLFRVRLPGAPEVVTEA
jgi:two-component system phosphate regulon sensor histidine kinase PhoR